MPSPDFSEYIDLTLFDEQPDVIYENAVDYARIALPEFAPRAGTVEDAILQSTSLLASVTLGAINRLPDGLMEGIMKLLGVVRKEATFGSVDIEFELSANGLLVPADTIVFFLTTDGDITVQYPFILETEVTASANSNTVTGTLISEVAGILPSIPVNTVLNLAQASTAVLSATTASVVVQGNRAETQTEYFNRASTFLESLSNCLATSSQVENYILTNYQEVYRCKVYDLTKIVSFTPPTNTTQNATKSNTTTTVSTNSQFVSDLYTLDSQLLRVISPSLTIAAYETAIPSGHFVGASAGSASVASASVTYTDTGVSGTYGPVSIIAADSLLVANTGDSPGHFAVFVCDAEGKPLSISVKNTIYDDVAERITAGLSFVVLDAFPFDINLVITISVDPTFGASVTAVAVAEEVESYISLPNWPDWSSFIRIFDIVARVSRIPGVQYVYSIVPSIPNLAEGALKNNEILAAAVNNNGQLIGYQIDYIGTLPKATVEVVVI